MQSREFGRRPLASMHRGRRIFNRRRGKSSRSALMVGTVVVGVALVFTIGFKVGRTYQTDHVAAVDQTVGAFPETLARNEALDRE